MLGALFVLCAIAVRYDRDRKPCSYRRHNVTPSEREVSQLERNISQPTNHLMQRIAIRTQEDVASNRKLTSCLRTEMFLLFCFDHPLLPSAAGRHVPSTYNPRDKVSLVVKEKIQTGRKVSSATLL